jgi:hypothetical protein
VDPIGLHPPIFQLKKKYSCQTHSVSIVLTVSSVCSEVSLSPSLSLSCPTAESYQGETSWRCVSHLTNSKLPLPPSPKHVLKQLIEISTTWFVSHLAARDSARKCLFIRFLCNFKTSWRRKTGVWMLSSLNLLNLAWTLSMKLIIQVYFVGCWTVFSMLDSGLLLRYIEQNCRLRYNTIRQNTSPPPSGWKSKPSNEPGIAGFLLGLLFNPTMEAIYFSSGTLGSLRITQRYSPEYRSL